MIEISTSKGQIGTIGLEHIDHQQKSLEFWYQMTQNRLNKDLWGITIPSFKFEVHLIRLGYFKAGNKRRVRPITTKG